MRIARVWRDWQLMQRMRCTWTELQEQPAEVLALIGEFVAGEQLARKAMEDQRANATPSRRI